MRAYVDGRKIVIEGMGAEEGRAILSALRAAIASYKSKAKKAANAAEFCLEHPRAKSPEMRARALELQNEAAGFAHLAKEAAALADELEPAIRNRAVV